MHQNLPEIINNRWSGVSLFYLFNRPLYDLVWSPLRVYHYHLSFTGLYFIMYLSFVFCCCSRCWWRWRDPLVEKTSRVECLTSQPQKWLKTYGGLPGCPLNCLIIDLRSWVTMWMRRDRKLGSNRLCVCTQELLTRWGQLPVPKGKLVVMQKAGSPVLRFGQLTLFRRYKSEQ